MGKIILTFAGQGAQYYQMGKELYEISPTFKFWLQKFDALMKCRWGISLLHEIYDSDKTFKDPMEEIRISHPALFAIQYAAAQMVLEDEKEECAVFGFSLGEMVAMALAEIWPFEEAFIHLLEQVEWLLSSKHLNGRLLAVFAANPLIEKALTLHKNEYVCAIQSFSNLCTLSMPSKSVACIKLALQNQNIFFQQLPVEYPFHSPWLEPMQEFFEMRRAAFCFLPPKRLFLSCLKQKSITEVSPTHLWEIVRQPIALGEALQHLFKESDWIVDCSPTATIKALIRAQYGLQSPIFKKSRSLMSPGDSKKG